MYKMPLARVKKSSKTCWLFVFLLSLVHSMLVIYFNPLIAQEIPSIQPINLILYAVTLAILLIVTYKNPGKMQKLSEFEFE